NELALFAGAGGGILGGKLLGWRTVCAVERDAYAAQVLAQRQNDGALRPFPIWSDVCSFDGRPWRGIVDVVSGGFPCQDISLAGTGDGLDGARSGLWREFARVVRDVQPGLVYVENSPALTSRGLGVVLGDLAALGFDARWGVVSAADTGAPHLRERIWILANASCRRCGKPQSRKVEQSGGAEIVGAGHVADADREPRDEGRPGDAEKVARGWNLDRGCQCPPNMGHGHGQGLAQRQGQPSHARQEQPATFGAGRWPAEPELGRVADGVAHRVDRIKAIGNGQVPRVAATAWRLLGGN
ncbi:MAG: DNA cytosine methyltransferase, partial [Rhodoferax sp.]|nr:DNA cytosine methyltransferase [Rhodoferax sp.]